MEHVMMNLALWVSGTTLPFITALASGGSHPVKITTSKV